MPHLTHAELIRLFRVPPDSKVRLGKHDPAWMGTPELAALGRDTIKARAKEILQRNVVALAEAQELLWASDQHAVLVIFQAMDAAGKDGTIKHVMSGLNPQGCTVHAFKRPSDEELDHTFLWRCQKVLPRRGEIVVFNRSYYEDVLITRVHPEILNASKLPAGTRGKSFWNARYDDINAMERHLVRNGTIVLKFFLNVSKAEQKRRFLERLDDPSKHWKFAVADVHERRYWDDYMDAYDDMLEQTSTECAPWWIIPADHKFVTRALVGVIITDAIRSLRLSYPKVGAAQRRQLEEARRELLSKKKK